MSNQDGHVEHPLSGPAGSGFEEPGLDYLPMPKGMGTFSPAVLPDPEVLSDREGTLRCLESVIAGARRWQPDERNIHLDVSTLSDEERRLLDEVLGDGEVSARLPGHGVVAQESVFAGVWRVADAAAGRDRLEIGPVPDCLLNAFAGASPAPRLPAQWPEGVMNAPGVLSELTEHLDVLSNNGRHVINLSLLPLTPEDHECLDEALGRSETAVLSRGYGNCRVTATTTAGVWWVQYFNSVDVLILNTLEVVAVPDVVCAAPEDIADSADRVAEVLEVTR
ncbi:hydrogenase expression/formation protein [Alkalilimnicola ehrlichii]|uniref:hydrogenase expression/formation protein n=1 Tax=Alkalilimnicola ehrlichii TaxID=351052 RepID=UPI003B9E1815